MSSPSTGIAESGTAMGCVLLVCADSAVVQQLSESMQQLAIATEVCVDVSAALRQLNRKKFEAIIVDFGLAQADDMLGQVRLSPSNRTAVTFAITDSSKPAILDPAELSDGKTAFRRLGRANIQGRFRIDCARTKTFVPLSSRDSGSPPRQWRGGHLPHREHQRGRNGDHGVAFPEARSAVENAFFTARRIAAFPNRVRGLLV